MNREELLQLISNALLPLGFTRRKAWWRKKGSEVDTLVNLQKSQFGDQFYVNFGYIMNAVPLDGSRMHLERGLGTTDDDMRTRIQELFNLASPIPDPVRSEEISLVLAKYLIPEVANVHDESELLMKIESMPTMNAVPLITKKHFGRE